MKTFVNSITGGFRFCKRIIISILCFLVWLGVLSLMIFSKIPFIESLQFVSSIKICISGIMCSILTIPIAVNFLPIFEGRKIKAENLSRKTLIEKNKQNEVEKIQLKNEVAKLHDEIQLLKNAQFSMQNFKQISELALVEVPLSQNDVHKETIKHCKGVLADEVFTETLVICSNEINAKFGVDFNSIRIQKQNEKIIISGIKSKWIGSDKFSSEVILSEIRETKIKDGYETSRILNSKEAKAVSIKKEREYAQNWQNRLEQGLETNFLTEPVTKLAQNFIKTILSPLGMPLEFSDDENSQNIGLPILEFISEEIKEKEHILNMQQVS